MCNANDRFVTTVSYDGCPETRAFWGGKLPHWDVLGRPVFLTLHVQGAIPPQAAARIRDQVALLKGQSQSGPRRPDAGGDGLARAHLCEKQAAYLQSRPRAEVGHIVGQTSGPRRPDAGLDAGTQESDYTRRLKLIFRNMEAWLDRADQAPVLTHPGVCSMLKDAIEQRERRGWWRILHWVVMPSHLHILYMGGTKGMKSLMTDFKRWTGRQAAELLDRGGKPFWQEEWFDHWSRTADETDRIASYIRENPVKAGLVTSSERWPYGSWTVGRSAL